MAQRQLQRSFVGGEMSKRMFGRPDDPRFQHGAAQLQNLITTPQGPAQKRPGLRFVREIKDSSNRARLIPFNFSQDDTLILEMGRSTVDSREIGYFRFHTAGTTLLFTLPPPFKASSSVSAVSTSTEQFLTPLTTDFTTGDPILFTMFPSSIGSATFAISDPGVVTVANGMVHGQQILFDSLLGGGTLPPEVETQRVYYASNPTGSDTRISESRFGPEIAFSVASTATVRVTFMPHSTTFGFIDVRRTFYFILVTPTTFQIAASREDALAGTAIDITEYGGGAESLFVSFHYRVGDLLRFTDGLSYYLFRAPLGNLDSLTIAAGEIAVPLPTDTSFWSRQPGAFNVVTFDIPNDEVDWTAHPNSNGDTVIFSEGTPPTGIVLGTVYFIVNSGTNDFQIAATLGGTPIVLSGVPSGNTTALAQSILEVTHFFELSEILEVNYAQSNDVLTITHPNRPAIELSRLGPTRWRVGAIRFNQARPPIDLSVSATSGFGFVVLSVTAADPAVITTELSHGILTLVDSFMVKDVGDIPDGIYVARAVTLSTITLGVLGTHADQASGTTDLGDDPIVQPGSSTVEFNQAYVTTSIDSKNEESGPSDEVAVVNNLLAEGAFNTATWSEVPGAQLYRLYKKETGIGVFGLIAEIASGQPLVFEDDNVAPNLSITAPIVDNSLRRLETVTFSLANSRVNLVDHGLVAGQAVALQATGSMPPEITAYKTLFVVDPTDNSFSVAATSGGTPIVLTTAGSALERYEVSIGLFPSSVAYFEQRRTFGGSLTRRQRVTMTSSATESDVSFSIPTVDSDRISFDVAAREGGAILHIVPISHLMVLSNSTEYRVTPINDDAITPTSISIRPQSFVGASRAQPAIVNNNAIFVANRGGHVREMGFGQNVLSYLTGDLSLRATHLFDGLEIEQIAYSKAPQPIIWFISSNGDLLGLTYIPEETVLGWHHHETDGTFESCAIVSEGDEDHLYVIVRRTINGVPVRYVERMANLALDLTTPLISGFFVDAGLTYTGVPATVITGLAHLEGEAVVVLADGLVVRGLTVTSGQITLATAASTVHVGLAYITELETLPTTLQLPAGGLDKVKNVSQVWLRVEESGAFTLGPDLASLAPSDGPAAGSLLNQSLKTLIPGTWDSDGQIFVQQLDPVPLTLVSVVYEVQDGG